MSILRAIEFKVGVLVVTVASLIAFMSMQVSEDPSYMGRSTEAWFLISDAGGLVKSSSVKMAGIPMGIIKDIRYQEGKARIEMVLRSDVKLTVSAAVDIKAVGILGDKYVEIFPGFPADPPLENGGQILNVKDRGSIDSLISQVSEITTSLAGVSKILQESVQDEGNRKHILGRIVSNIEKITADLSDMSAENKGKIGEIVDNVRNVTQTLDDLVNAKSDSSLKATWSRSVASIDKSLKNLEEITDKVNRGEGTIGKLVNDESTVEELNTAIEGVNSFLGSADKMSTAIEFHTEYLGEIGAYKTYAGVRIQPGLDRYYLIQAVDDPDGVSESSSTKTTTGGVTTEIDEEKRLKNKIKLTALFAKNFYQFTFRGGLMESSGGLGVDYRFFRNKIKLSLDAFDFSKLHIKAHAQYFFWKGFYLVGGVNDSLNNSGKYSNYLGMGLSLTNDDLKLFASQVSF